MTYYVGRVYKDIRSGYPIFILSKDFTYDYITDKQEIVYRFYYLDLPDEVENTFERHIKDVWVEV